MVAEERTTLAGFSFRKYLGFGVLAVLLVGSFYLIQDASLGTSQSTVDNNISEVELNPPSVGASANIGTSDNKNSNASGNSSGNKPKQNPALIHSAIKNNPKSQKVNNTTLANHTTSETNTSLANNNNVIKSTSNGNNQKLAQSSGSSKIITSSNATTNIKTNQISNEINLSGSSTQNPSSERSEKAQNAAQNAAGNIGGGGNSTDNIYESAQNHNNNNILPSLNQESEEAANQNTLYKQSISSKINSLFALESYANLKHDADAIDVCHRNNSDACTGGILNLRKKVDCYNNWNGDRSKISILPFVGLEFVTNDQSRTETSMTDYLNLRRNTMKFLEVKKAGILLKYNVTPHLYAKVGFEYDQINEKFESIVISSSEKVDPDGIIAYRLTMEGDTIPVIGPVTTTIISTATWKKYNKYHSFNIPVIVGYEAPISKRWDYFTEAGIFYNLRFNYEGKLLDTNNEVVSGENFYLNKTGISVYGGAGLRFNINKRWSVFGAGSYKYNLATINNADINPIKQNLGLAGFAIGAEIRL